MSAAIRAYQAIDRAIGAVVKTAGDANIVVFSAHGMCGGGAGGGDGASTGVADAANDGCARPVYARRPDRWRFT